MTTPYVNQNDRRWAKSSHSGTQHVCVELTCGARDVRDTKNARSELNLDPIAGTALLDFARRYRA